MKTGDPKQIRILSIVAVGAVGYLGFTLIGAGQKVASRLTSAGDRKVEASSREDLPTELIREPFAHPILITQARNMGNREAAPPQVTELNQTSSRPPAWSFGGGFGGAFMQPSVRPMAVEGPYEGEKPAESAGPDRKEVRAPGPTVALTAIVKVERRMAFLSVNGGETRAFKEGTLVVPGLRVIEIHEDRVKLRTPSKLVELRVGGEVKL